MTSIEWFIDNLPKRFKNSILNSCGKLIDVSKQMDREDKQQIMKQAYNQGYTDATLNHINDADQYAYEQDYINNII